jgi:hypothetical protein
MGQRATEARRGILLSLDRWGFSAMLSGFPCIIAFTVMLVALPTAQAADTTLTLACKGKETSESSGGRMSSEVINRRHQVLFLARSPTQ